MQFSLTYCCYFLSLMSKFFLRTLFSNILSTYCYVFFIWRPSSTHKQNATRNVGSLEYILTLNVFRSCNSSKHVPKINLLFISSSMQFRLVTAVSKFLNFYHIRKGFFITLIFMILACILTMTHKRKSIRHSCGTVTADRYSKTFKTSVK
jgi:hypothetical protein